ncbi:hypothetical protein KKD62_03370 [Patescibacteria group bacterium]|nr:hypothetical protein [Patescibacteria group bacterium]
MKHYPDNPHTRYKEWNWCKDEFVPPLSAKQISLYIRKPEKYRQALLKNLKLYIKFCLELKKQVFRIRKLPESSQLAALLVILFLFQSAMDHHYYHYDYPLDLENYSKSPLGWHYLRIKKIVTDMVVKIEFENPQQWITEKALYLLSKKGAEVIQEFEPYLAKQVRKDLKDSYGAIMIYIKVQQEEEKLFYGKNKKGPIFITGCILWDALNKLISKTKGYYKNKRKLIKILAGDPIYGTRKIIVDMEKLFSDQITEMVKTELNNW